ncbi:MAG: hypothetical protein QME57_05450 [Patescibacteria group bacterium]|nr:hypothetical protein [Patescibacteria group bacterium]MDI6645381.1 hypothetical protein [Methanobacteriaceae archaeon]
MEKKYKDDYASKIFLKDQEPKKEEEKEIVKNFLLRLQIEYIDIIESEKPDLIIKFPSNLNVGCEVTKYYSDQFFEENPNKGKKFFVEWKRFAQKLRDELLKRNESYKHIYGVIHFKQKQNLNHLIYGDSFIRELVNIVDNNYMDLNPSKGIYTHKIEGKNFDLVRKYVEYIYLKNIYPKDQYLWWPAHLQSSLISNSEETVESIILHKNKLSSNYIRKNLSQKWLIIFAEGLGLNDICIIGNLKQKIIDDVSYFSNIFIFDKFTETITQVYPEYEKVFDWSKKAIYVKYLPII